MIKNNDFINESKIKDILDDAKRFKVKDLPFNLSFAIIEAYKNCPRGMYYKILKPRIMSFYNYKDNYTEKYFSPLSGDLFGKCVMLALKEGIQKAIEFYTKKTGGQYMSKDYLIALTQRVYSVTEYIRSKKPNAVYFENSYTINRMDFQPDVVLYLDDNTIEILEIKCTNNRNYILNKSPQLEIYKSLLSKIEHNYTINATWLLMNAVKNKSTNIILDSNINAVQAQCRAGEKQEYSNIAKKLFNTYLDPKLFNSKIILNRCLTCSNRCDDYYNEIN